MLGTNNRIIMVTHVTKDCGVARTQICHTSQVANTSLLSSFADILSASAVAKYG